MLFDEQIQDYFKKQAISSKEIQDHLKLKLQKLLKLLEEPKGVAALCNMAVQVNCYLIGLELDLENTFNVNFNPYRHQLMLGLVEEDVTTPLLCEDK